MTGDITGIGMYTPIIADYAVPTGNGEYAVRGIDSTRKDDSQPYPGHVCYSGWSLIILYESPTETAHQFYLYDPIHNPYDPVTNPDGFPFYIDQYQDVDFSLVDFYPPEGTVEGKMTYFVGEGDQVWVEDYIQFKGGSVPAFPSPGPDTTLHDPNGSDPNGEWWNVISAKSTNGERGLDIDTFQILDSVGSDTEADIRLHTDVDIWTLSYVILAFKTEMEPKADYFFNVAAVTYSYELGRN
ncbi:MAG: hypothetical protein E3J81_06990 [Dehalococcoidia bacterium]|nr:MAG: hypothetical protein E3J81_06990 [Dehalococcoidia bacterium]